MNKEIDNVELKKIEINKKLFSIYKTDHFEIKTVLEILDTDTLPIDIPLNNNQIFIRDLTRYVVENKVKLKPNINKK